MAEWREDTERERTMKIFKLSFLTLLLGAIFLVAPATTFAREEAEAECAEAEANAASIGLAAAAAAFLLVPSGIVAIRRRRRQS